MCLVEKICQNNDQLSLVMYLVSSQLLVGKELKNCILRIRSCYQFFNFCDKRFKNSSVFLFQLADSETQAMSHMVM